MAIPFIFFLLVGALLFYIVVQCGLSIAQGIRQKNAKKIITGVVLIIVLIVAMFLFYNMAVDLFVKYELLGGNTRKVL